MSELHGHVTLVVNVASHCGYARENYKGLQRLYSRYYHYGLVILAFPSNQVCEWVCEWGCRVWGLEPPRAAAAPPASHIPPPAPAHPPLHPPPTPTQFGQQEPGSLAEIEEHCRSEYGVTFRLMQKVDVNGARAHPLFAWLKRWTPALPGHEDATDVEWNWEKFLVDRWAGRGLARAGRGWEAGGGRGERGGSGAWVIG